MVERMDETMRDSRDQVAVGAGAPSVGGGSETLGGGLNVPDSNQFGNSSRIRAHSFRLISKMAMVSWTSWRRIQPEVVEGEGTI